MINQITWFIGLGNGFLLEETWRGRSGAGWAILVRVQRTRMLVEVWTVKAGS